MEQGVVNRLDYTPFEKKSPNRNHEERRQCSFRHRRSLVKKNHGILNFLFNREIHGNLPPKHTANKILLDSRVHNVMEPKSKTLDIHDIAISKLVMPNPRTIISSSWDGSLRVIKNGMNGWKSTDALVESGDSCYGMAKLSATSIVSCSSDGFIVVWHEKKNSWCKRYDHKTDKPCTNIEALSSTRFIITTEDNWVGIAEEKSMKLDIQWFNQFGRVMEPPTKLNKKSFIHCSSNGNFYTWKMGYDGWEYSITPCPEKISREESNSPLKAILINENSVAVCYSMGDIAILTSQNLAADRDKNCWKITQLVFHGEDNTEFGEVTGILPLSNNTFASYGEDGNIFIWYFMHNLWVQRQKLSKHQHAIADCQLVAPERIWSIDNCGSVQCWLYDGEKHQHYCELIGIDNDIDEDDEMHVRPAGLLPLSGNCAVASFSGDCKIRIWPDFLEA
ncbi:hypothetical protein ElyMa_000182700 [Elysia marginata]|uniref:Uncharacterized protein n=1 Tax=Elysia marginata TaxID=1093978 RepID=A0AAV4EVE9_9GAST|nr:hypothetical protein ElyMa_000182700 [Elysia marginata]